MCAILGVHFVRVKQLARVALDGGHLIHPRRPLDWAILFKPLVKEQSHLIRRARGEHLVLPLLRDVLASALGDDFLLLVQQHHVLVQKRRAQDVGQPPRRGECEQVQFKPTV